MLCVRERVSQSAEVGRCADNECAHKCQVATSERATVFTKTKCPGHLRESKHYSYAYNFLYQLSTNLHPI